MNSSSSIISVTELRNVLLEINNCELHAIVKNDDDTIAYDEPCTMQVMCDSCIDKFASLLEWAEDSNEDEAKQEVPTA